MPARHATSETAISWQSLKRQSIQDAVIRLMRREGLASVTMESVAREVGIAKGTVYLHYKDKQELLDAVKESALAPLTECIDEALEAAATPAAKLREYALAYLRYFEERSDLFRILLYEREVQRAQGSRYQSKRYRHLTSRVSAAIADGIGKGIFREVDAGLSAAVYVEGLVAVLYQRLLGSRKSPVEDDAALVSDIFIRGIAARRRN